jgi:lytic murein transglycosylase
VTGFEKPKLSLSHDHMDLPIARRELASLRSASLPMGGMPMRRLIALGSFLLGFVGLLAGVVSTTANAASCGSGGAGFPAWLDAFEREAAAKGISQTAIQSGLSGVTYDPSIIFKDRHQGVFHQSFAEFSGRMVPPRLGRAASLLKQNAGLFSRIEQQFGVPGAVIVAIWGLETDFGAGSGNEPTIRALATLAYDCRRSEKFHEELLDALQLVQRGDLTPGQMHGAWAGELGQTQFMPSSYLKFAVNYSHGGRPDLIHSSADALASTANYLRGYGWKRGQPWGEGTANFQVLLQWNKSTVYTETVAYFASRLAGG